MLTIVLLVFRMLLILSFFHSHFPWCEQRCRGPGVRSLFRPFSIAYKRGAI